MSLVRLLPIGAALLCAVSLSAQSLADMARRAEEQRKAAKGKSRHIELGSARGVRTLPLDKLEVESYVSLRIRLAQLWHFDHALFERVRGGLLMARSTNEWTQVFAAEPDVMKILNRYKYSPEGLLAMTKSLAETERLADSGFDMSTLSQVQRDNYEFGRSNREWLTSMRGRIYRAEAGLTLFR
jgi:hypothetical protein